MRVCTGAHAHTLTPGRTASFRRICTHTRTRDRIHLLSNISPPPSPLPPTTQTHKHTRIHAPTDFEDGEGPQKLHARLTQKAHDKDINAVAVAPNDKLLCTGSHDRTAKVCCVCVCYVCVVCVFAMCVLCGLCVCVWVVSACYFRPCSFGGCGAMCSYFVKWSGFHPGLRACDLPHVVFGRFLLQGTRYRGDCPGRIGLTFVYARTHTHTPPLHGGFYHRSGAHRTFLSLAHSEGTSAVYGRSSSRPWTSAWRRRRVTRP